MGKAPNRDLMWGAFDSNPADTTHEWAWAWSSGGWYTSLGNSNYVVYNANSYAADLNLFAYQASSQVPEPSTLLLLGSGLGGFAMLRRFKKG